MWIFFYLQHVWRLMKNDFLPHGCFVHAKCIWWNSGKRQFLWCFSTRVINFCHLLKRGVTFPDAHFYCNLYADGFNAPRINATRHLYLQSIHLFLDCWFSFFTSMLCFYIFGKHTFTSPIFVCIFLSFFSKAFCTRCKFIFLMLACSSTRYTVWFGRLCVVLIFYKIFYSHCFWLLWELNGDRTITVQSNQRKNMHFCLCADF